MAVSNTAQLLLGAQVRRAPLPLHVYQAHGGTVAAETQQAKLKLLKSAHVPKPRAAAAPPPPPWRIGRLPGVPNEEVQWRRISDVHITKVHEALDDLSFDVCRHRPPWVHPGTCHGEHLKVPCVVLPASHEKYDKNICIWREVWRCNGGCGCVSFRQPSGTERPCRVLVKFETYAKTPTQVSMFRNTLASQYVEAHEHCGPDMSAQYHEPVKRRLSRELKKDISQAATKKQTAAQYLAAQRGRASWARTAAQNGVPLTPQALQQADFSNRRVHPNQQQVSDQFRRQAARGKVHLHDATAVDTITRGLSALAGFFVFHRPGSATEPEILVISREELAVEAIKSYQVVGWDAGHGLNAYGHKHWEHVNVQQHDGSHKGIPTAFCSTSDDSRETQYTALQHLYAYFQTVAATHKLPFRYPLAALIDKDIKSNQAWRQLVHNICIIYCLWHFNMWLTPVLNTKDNGVHESQHFRVKAQIDKMRRATSKEVFESLWAKYKSEWGMLYPVFLTIFEDALMNKDWGDTWLECYRQHLPHELIAVFRTNMLTESQMRFTKMVQFCGKHNKRLDKYILEMINKGAYFAVESIQRSEGLLKVKAKQKKATDNAVTHGQSLYLQGRVSDKGDAHFVDDGHLQFVVRQVRIQESKALFFSCTCPAYTGKRDQCAHIVATKKFIGVWRPTVARDGDNGGRPANIQPREQAPSGRTYKRLREDMEPVKVPGRKLGSTKRTLSAAQRQERLGASQ
jgi:hypothetical protein